MLQPTVRLQLAGINFQKSHRIIRTIMEVRYQPPFKVTLSQFENVANQVSPNAKHWFVGGERCLAAGVKLLLEGKVIAVPTDTVYGLATLAQNEKCIKKLYDLKSRDENKPLAICVSSIKDIRHWGEIDHLPPNLLMSLLPGPTTVVLKRQPKLNSFLNPGHTTIGIRVTVSKFVRSLCKILDQPLALTSANLSNQPSPLIAEEFEHLWPQLGGIFYAIPNKQKLDESYRVGSTVVDLTEANKFKIIRKGVQVDRTVRILCKYGLKMDE